ncbi:MAG: hypothetical protein JWL84_6153 [Rhodospirillales bacterium]|nr:hypothetical protein [Rhodospirillales bacterium]
MVEQVVDGGVPSQGRQARQRDKANGTIPHAARGVARTCPAMRMTLMFKTEVIDVEPDNS